MYDILESLGVKLDIRGFKTRTVKCKNTECHFAKKGFKDKVQAEVDVSIVMKVMLLVMKHPELENVVLVAGDRDFTDLLQFLHTTHIKVNLFGFRANLSSNMFDILEQESVFYINDFQIWKSLLPNTPESTSVSPVLKQFASSEDERKTEDSDTKRKKRKKKVENPKPTPPPANEGLDLLLSLGKTKSEAQKVLDACGGRIEKVIDYCLQY